MKAPMGFQIPPIPEPGTEIDLDQYLPRLVTCAEGLKETTSKQDFDTIPPKSAVGIALHLLTACTIYLHITIDIMNQLNKEIGELKKSLD